MNIFFYPTLPTPTHAHICTHTFAHTSCTCSLELFEALTALRCYTVSLSNPALFMTGHDKTTQTHALPFLSSTLYSITINHRCFSRLICHSLLPHFSYPISFFFPSFHLSFISSFLSLSTSFTVEKRSMQTNILEQITP